MHKKKEIQMTTDYSEQFQLTRYPVPVKAEIQITLQDSSGSKSKYNDYCNQVHTPISWIFKLSGSVMLDVISANSSK